MVREPGRAAMLDVARRGAMRGDGCASPKLITGEQSGEIGCAPHVATAGRIAVRASTRRARARYAPGRARRSPARRSRQSGPSRQIAERLEAGRREVHRAALAERDDEARDAGRERRRRRAPSDRAPSSPSRLRSPAGNRSSRTTRPRSAVARGVRSPFGCTAHDYHVQIAVDRTAKMLAEQLHRLEIELPAAQEVDVERVEPREVEHRLEASPASSRNAAGEESRCAARRCDSAARRVDWVRHLDQRGIGRGALAASGRTACARAARSLADLDERHDLPVVGERGVESARARSVMPPHSSIGHDARIAAVDHVPDERADDAEAALRRRRGYRRRG